MREGVIIVIIVAQSRRTPLLTFAVRGHCCYCCPEQKNPTLCRVCSKGGDCCCHQGVVVIVVVARAEEPPPLICSEGGGHCHCHHCLDQKNPPSLAFAAREGFVVIVVIAQSRSTPPCSCQDC